MPATPSDILFIAIVVIPHTPTTSTLYNLPSYARNSAGVVRLDYFGVGENTLIKIT